MAVETEDDRLFVLQDFGLTCKHAGSPDFLGIFDSEYLEVLNTEGRELTLLCRTSDLAKVGEGEIVKVDGVNYTARTHRPDGQGMTELVLEAI